MPVDSRHKDFLKWQDEWRKIRDAEEGEPAVKAAGTTYLPMPDGMAADKKYGPADYEKYLALATFLEASNRTHKGWEGTMLRKPIGGLESIPDVLTPRLTNMDRRGTSLEDMIKRSVHMVLGLGRWGILIDKPANNATDLPYLVPYDTEQIIDWQETVVEDGPPILSHVRVEDCYSIPNPTDEFVPIERKRIRVFDFGDTGFYRTRTFLQDEKDKMPDLPQETTMPTRREEGLDFLPFFFFNPSSDPSPGIFTPPLLGVVNENFAHYRTTADAEHVRHLTGCPTFVVADTGAKGSTEDIRLGGLSVLKIETGGSWGVLGITGSEMGPQMDSLKMRLENMAMLGARMLEPQRAGVEAAETHHLRQSGEAATLVDVANSCSKSWTEILKRMAWWAGVPDTTIEKIRIQLSTDFVPAKIDAGLLREYLASVQQGAMSVDSLIWNLQAGESLPPGRTVEEEKALIEEDKQRALPPPQERENEIEEEEEDEEEEEEEE